MNALLIYKNKATRWVSVPGKTPMFVEAIELPRPVISRMGIGPEADLVPYYNREFACITPYSSKFLVFEEV